MNRVAAPSTRLGFIAERSGRHRVAGWAVAVAAMGWAITSAAFCAQEPPPNTGSQNGTPATAPHVRTDTDRQFARRHWRREHGLPGNEVTCLHQTRNGYLWIGTDGGLARYDGTGFAVWSRANTPAMEGPRVQALAEDDEGRLWVLGEEARSHWMLRQEAGSFARPCGTDGAPLPPAVKMTSDAAGGVWLEYSDGLRRWKNGRWELAQGVEPPFVRAMAADRSGRFWVEDSQAVLVRFDDRTTPAPANFPRLPETKSFPVFACDGDGALWALAPQPAGRRLRGVYELEYALFRLREDGWRPALSHWFHNGARPLFLAFDPVGRAWLPAGNEAAISAFHDGQLVKWAIPGMAADDFVLTVLPDREGNLWLGFEQSGLQCWTPRRVGAITRHEGLPHDQTWTLAEAPSGEIWVGTDAGVARLRVPPAGPFSPAGPFTLASPVEAFPIENTLPHPAVRALAFDAAGGLWVGTGGGLARFDGERWNSIRFPDPEGRTGPNKVRCLHRGATGRVWASTQEAVYELGPAGLTDPPAPFPLAGHLPKTDVRAILEGPDGTLWLGTAGGGLCAVTTPGPAGQPSVAVYTTADGLASDHVWAIHRDDTGALWLGTERGLSRFVHGRFHGFGAREGLFDDAVNHVLEDDLGCLWLSSDHGVYRVRRTDLEAVAAGRATQVRAVRYDEPDGMPSPETNGQKSQPAGLRTRDGRLWFPTTKGIAVFDPHGLPDLTHPPGVALREVRANGRTLFTEGQPTQASANTPATLLAPGANPIELPPGSARFLEFTYAAICLTDADRVRFRHRLEGFGDGWFEAGGDRKAVFTDLRPGRYTFHVQAANRHGVWSEATATLAFVIQPYWHQTWWFRAALAAAMPGSLAAVVLWRVRQLHQRSRLEARLALEAERERLTRDLHDGLGADLARLQRLAAHAEDEARRSRPLAALAQELGEVARGTTRQLRDALWITHPADPSLEGLVARLQTEAESILRAAGVRCRFDISPALPNVELRPDQRRHLLLFTREALTNIVRHAHATAATLGFAVDGGRLILTVRDDGCGFTAPPTSPAKTHPGGRGLANLEARAAALGGQVTIESRPGGGTLVRLAVALPAD